ncbi:MAG: hypothetical protein KKB25_03430, partial [Nanoarchaeota archaeon]|nr:hypothetical protein [Nanoarchaeota archaeon]
VPDFYFELYFNAKTVFTKCTKTFSFRHAENPADFRASKIKQQMRTVLILHLISYRRIYAELFLFKIFLSQNINYSYAIFGSCGDL